jgi:hypothetical protein
MAASLHAAALVVFVLLSSAAALEPPEFAVYRSNIAALSVTGGNGSFGSTLDKILNGWQYTLPLEYVRRGQAFVGPNARLRRVMNDMMAGEDIYCGSTLPAGMQQASQYYVQGRYSTVYASMPASSISGTCCRRMIAPAPERS